MKIAFCFLAVRDIKNIDIWQRYFVNSMSEYKIFIHSKERYNEYPEHSVFKNKLISGYAPTKWGRLVKAQILLWREAFNWNCDYVVLLSDKCLPLNHYDMLYYFLQQLSPKSIMPYSNPWWTIPYKHKLEYDLKGAPQWNIINKQHLLKLITSQIILHDILKYSNHVDDETYPATVFNHFDYLNINNIMKYQTTFVDWSRRSNDRKHPYTFNIITKSDEKLLYKIAEKFLFGRKFNEFIYQEDKQKIYKLLDERLFTFNDIGQVNSLEKLATAKP